MTVSARSPRTEAGCTRSCYNIQHLLLHCNTWQVCCIGAGAAMQALSQCYLTVQNVCCCRAVAFAKGKQVGAAAGSSRKFGGPAAAAAKPSAEEVARRREQLAAAAEARLKTLQQKQQLWSVSACTSLATACPLIMKAMCRLHCSAAAERWPYRIVQPLLCYHSFMLQCNAVSAACPVYTGSCESSV